jgi:hypothetical protein
MKKIPTIITIIVVALIAFSLGRQSRQQAYEDACHMSDLIRCYQDHLATDSLIQDYGCFEELCGNFLWDDCVSNPPVSLEKYVYCY